MNQQSRFSRSQVIEPASHDDEIDLFDLWDDIVAHKLVIFVGFAFCLSLAIAYLFVTKPVYQVKSVIKPVGEQGLVEINVPQLNGIYSLGVEAAFEHSKRAMLSKESQRLFYHQYLAEIKGLEGLYNAELSEAQNVKVFGELLGVKLSNKKDAETFIELALELGEPTLAANLLNSFVAFSLQNRLQEIQQIIDSKLRVRLNKLEYDASLIRDKYYSSKIQRKLKLDEARKIANSVGQVDPIYSESDILGSFKPPLYMYGSKALSAEEQALSQREVIAKNLPHGEEHFIVGLPEILFEIGQLKKLDVDYSKVRLAQIDESALAPLSPVKPKKLLIVILASVVGLFAGVLMALLTSAYNRHVKRA